MIFLMVALPIVIILVVNFTISVVIGDAFIAVESITLSQTSITANVDDTLHLDYTIYPTNATNKDVIWSSDNEEVARVDVNGNVTFVGFGEGHIIATSMDGNRRASCSFYVTDDKVHQVILTSPSTQIDVGQSVQLVANVLPNEAINKAVTYSSSNEEVARVGLNGLVLGLKAGEATITVTTEDGGFTDTIDITVVNPVTSITLSESEVITSKSYYQIEYTIMPSNASIKDVTYSCSDDTIASIDELGVVSFKKAGTAVVTVTTVSGGFSQDISITYTDGYAQDLILEPLSLNLKMGDSYLIDYQTVPTEIYNTQVSFRSLDTTVARVDSSGYIYALGGGNTIIEVSIDKNPEEKIIKQISLYVERDAENIEMDDIILTATKTFQLNPTSLPSDSTNTQFFYHSHSEETASVSESGLVEFKTDSIRTVQIDIYANYDYSNVKKTVTVTYTAGRASDFNIVNENIEMEYGEILSLDVTFVPTNTQIKDLSIEIYSSSPNADNEIVRILSDSRIEAVGGGSVILKVTYTSYNGNVITKYCNVKVTRDPEDLQLNLGLEMLNGQYVTALEQLSLNATVYPSDSTYQNITWSCTNGIGVVLNNSTFVFNTTGVAVLRATCGEFYKEIEVYYTASKPISATVKADYNGEKTEIPKTLNSTESFDIIIDSLFPSNASQGEITIKVTNQVTSAPNGHVLTVSGNTITAVNGGNATLIIYINTTITLSIDITVVREGESITIAQANTTTTEGSIYLTSTVLPVDTTNKGVSYEILAGNASIDGNLLTFNANGRVDLRAYLTSNPDISIDFYIDKIEKDAIDITSSVSNLSAVIGDLYYVDFLSFTTLPSTHGTITVTKGDSSIVEIDGGFIRVQGKGEITITIDIFNENDLVYTKNIIMNVITLVNDIVYNGDLDFYNNEYVTAQNRVDLDFSIYPNDAENKELAYNITSSNNIAYISGDVLYFLTAGTITLEISSKDGGASTSMTITYTDGQAIKADLNYQDEITLDLGQSVDIMIENIIPQNATIGNLVLSITGASDIISISGNRITALKSGSTILSVDINDDLTKIITVNVIKQVTEISIEDNILTSLASIQLNAQALPLTATNRELLYEIQQNDIAYLIDNVLYFNQAGSCQVKISATDGSNVSKIVTVTSTFGKICDITLSQENISLNKGDVFYLSVSQVKPSDIENYSISYEIISQQPNDDSLIPVISLDGNIIHALYGGNAQLRVWGLVDGEKVYYEDYTITVVASVDQIAIEFDNELQIYQNSFVTSLESLNFTLKVYPLDATLRDYTHIISDSTVAEIYEGVIKFKKAGRVVITFTGTDYTSKEISVSYNFYYTADNLISATIDESDFEQGVLTLFAGDKYQLKTEDLLPFDNKNLTYSAENVKIDAIDPNKNVLKFSSDGLIYALNGGRYSFTLKINNIIVGSYTIVVQRNAESILVDGDFVEEDGEKTLYVSRTSYQINANAMPSDTYQTELSYVSSNPSIASVDQSGLVSFYGYGKVTITVSIKDNPQVYTRFIVEYTNSLRGIYFTDITNTTFTVGKNVDFTIAPLPASATDFDYEITLSDNTAQATHTVTSDGRHRIIGNKAGTVTVIAQVINSDIKASITLEFISIITRIELELDSVDDVAGIGGYRYFGDRFYKYTNVEGNETIELVNTYQMQVNVQPSNNLKNMLIWSSSNENIALVDENGLVTFLGYGKVTITAKAKANQEGELVASDSYTFNIHKGINVFNNSEYEMAVNTLIEICKNSMDGLILHTDIKHPDSLTNEVNFNIYGNGHMIDLSEKNTGEKIALNENNLIFDNVTFRGNTFSANEKLSDLRGKGRIVKVSDKNNILFYNCIFENAETLVNVESSTVTFKGCVFRNSCMASLKISRKTIPSKAYVTDCIFANSLLSGILFDLDNVDQNPANASEVVLDGNVRFYNWVTIDELEQGFKADLENLVKEIGIMNNIVDDAVKQFKEMLADEKYQDFSYTYNGKDYYNFSILQYNISILEYEAVSNGKITKGPNFNSSNVYTDLSIEGTIKVAGGAANLNIKIDALSISGINPFIKPGESHESAIDYIRQEERVCV